jgi:cytoskeleton protein RodZ
MEQLDAERSLGHYLRSLRESKGGSLEEMARSTRVGLRHLEALEADKLGELPAPVFVRGFIRAYCSFLNEPADGALAHYRDMLGEGRPVEPGAPAPRPAASWSSSPILVSLALLAAFGVGLLAINGIFKRPPKAPAPVATAPEGVEAPKPTAAPGAETSPIPAAAPRPAAPVQADKPAPVGSPAQRLVVRAVEATWIRVQTDDGRVAEELLPPGATREWTSSKRFVLTVGNAGGIELELNGKPLAPLGAKGAVIQRLELPQGGS